MIKGIKLFVLAVVSVLLAANPALAEAAAGMGEGRGLVAIAAGLGLGLAVVGAAGAQGRATASAMESIGRNPNSAGSLQTPLIIALAFMEALGLLTFLVALQLVGKV